MSKQSGQQDITSEENSEAVREKNREIDKQKYNNRQHITRSHMSITTFLCYLLMLFFFGAYYFKQGFLLNRQTLEDINEVTSPIRPQYRKSIVILIDALRFDFTMETLDQQGNKITKEYLNKMPFLFDKVKNAPDNAILLKFLADAPTTTLQRIKGLTTGSLPTFIDAGANFSGTNITEDNIIKQLVNQNKTIRFLGDDTWLDLFPEHFTSPYGYNSFNVWDLDTVDNGIKKHFDDVFYNKDIPNKWDMIITHFLGVDHAGHTFGPENRKMSEKLEEMNNFIEKVYNMMDDDTLLLVFGDHGMDIKGDHGGESQLEIESALFMASKQPFRNYKDQKQVFKDIGLIQADVKYADFINYKKDNVRTVKQIDLVPTLALLLGFNIPFNNLGRIIPEMFIKDQNSIEYFLKCLNQNIKQVNDYLNKFNIKHIKQSLYYGEDLITFFQNSQKSFDNYFESKSDIDLVNFVQDSYHFLSLNLSKCIQLWAQFDILKIYMGLTLMFSSCFIILYHVMFRCYPDKTLSGFETLFNTVHGKVLAHIFIGGFIGAVAGVFRIIDIHASIEDNFLFVSLLGTVFGYVFNSVLDSISTSSYFRFNLQYYFTNNNRHIFSFKGILNVYNIIVIILIGAVNASVNMVIHEDKIVFYLLQIYHLILIGYSQFVKNRDQVYKKLSTPLLRNNLILMLLNTIQYFITVCREEQMPYCKPTFYTFLSASSSTTVAPTPILLFTALLAIIIPSFLTFTLKETKNYFTCAPYWLKYFMPFSMALISLYFVLDNVSHDLLLTDVFIYLKIWLVRIGLFSGVVAGLASFFSNVLLIEVQMIETTVEGKQNHSMVVLGLANSYGAPMLIFLSTVFLPLFATQLPMGSIMLSISLIKLIFFCQIFDIQKDLELLNNKQSQVVQPNAMFSKTLDFSTMIWVYLAAFLGFFSTGHQATLSSLQWKVGFVGLKDMNFFISPLLVILNTCGSHILHAVGILLIFHWKVTPQLKGMYQSIPYSLMRLFLIFLLLNGINLTCASFFAAWHKRHLMIWKLFAPRYLTSIFTTFSSITIALFVDLFFPSTVILNEVSDILSLLEK